MAPLTPERRARLERALAAEQAKSALAQKARSPPASRPTIRYPRPRVRLIVRPRLARVGADS
eukprot:24566-Pelagococcus_subviridis.AAC.3